MMEKFRHIEPMKVENTERKNKKGQDLTLFFMILVVNSSCKRKIHVVMPCNIIHVIALGEQIIDIAKIGISDNF